MKTIIAVILLLCAALASGGQPTIIDVTFPAANYPAGTTVNPARALPPKAYKAYDMEITCDAAINMSVQVAFTVDDVSWQGVPYQRPVAPCLDRAGKTITTVTSSSRITKGDGSVPDVFAPGSKVRTTFTTDRPTKAEITIHFYTAP